MFLFKLTIKLKIYSLVIMSNTKFEAIKGIICTVYEDFDTGEPIIKNKAIAFLLETDKKEEIIVVYDKNALKLGLIKVGDLITCLGRKDGTIIGKDQKGIIVEKQRFLCRGIMTDADITEEQLMKEGAIRLR